MLFLFKILKKENILMKSVYIISQCIARFISFKVYANLWHKGYGLNFVTHTQHTYFEWFWFEKCYFFILKYCIYLSWCFGLSENNPKQTRLKGSTHIYHTRLIRDSSIKTEICVIRYNILLYVSGVIFLIKLSKIFITKFVI